MYRPALISGAALAALAVVLGAFGAHALKGVLPPDQLPIYETAVRYQFYHCFALIAIGITYHFTPVRPLRMAASCMLAGIFLFSGSLYAMTLMSISGAHLGPVGVLTPIGGLCFIIGWVFFIFGIAKNRAL